MYFLLQVKTQQVDQFKEVTAGEDRLYSIPSTSSHHQGTYQCEIYSGQRSIVRLYYYLTGNKIHQFWENELKVAIDIDQWEDICTATPLTTASQVSTGYTWNLIQMLNVSSVFLLCVCVGWTKTNANIMNIVEWADGCGQLFVAPSHCLSSCLLSTGPASDTNH